MKKIMSAAGRFLTGSENIYAFILIILLALVPGIDFVLRKFFQSGIEGTSNITGQLVLLITCLGAMITSREDQHLYVAAGINAIPEKLRKIVHTVNGFAAVMLSTIFTWASLSYVFTSSDIANPKVIAGIPEQFYSIFLVLGFGVITIRFITHLKAGKAAKLIVAAGILFGTLLGTPTLENLFYGLGGQPPAFLSSLADFVRNISPGLVGPGIIILVILAAFGTPLFLVLGGIALLLFMGAGGRAESMPNEMYNLLIGNNIPAIPLFTLVGVILAESKAGERLVRLFKALFGWLPGGMAIAAVLVSAFFTCFTGASGVTILALGALLYYVLSKSGKFSDSFAIGFVTSIGSVGLLFAPSLPLILYGAQAQVNILHMFVGGFLPGLILVITMAMVGVFDSIRLKLKPEPFNLKEALKSLLESVWEILLPVLIIVLYFFGIMSLVETAAFAVVYVLVIGVFVNRDIPIKNILAIVVKSLPIIGGVLIIMSMSKGLSYYIVDAQLPDMLKTWLTTFVHSPIVFLLLLNLALLITGMFMDIFSAILVVVPLILPLGAAFGIDPIHLGIIFIANMELGYLTPPVGLNLFLGSYCFKKPLLEVAKDMTPFFLIRLVFVLLITFVPFLSTGLLDLFKMR